MYSFLIFLKIATSHGKYGIYGYGKYYLFCCSIIFWLLTLVICLLLVITNCLVKFGTLSIVIKVILMQWTFKRFACFI